MALVPRSEFWARSFSVSCVCYLLCVTLGKPLYLSGHLDPYLMRMPAAHGLLKRTEAWYLWTRFRV